MHKLSVTCILLSLLLLLPSLVMIAPVNAPRTITVPGNYSTIQQAIDAAGDGDTVFVKKGVYNEQIVIDKQLILRGEDKTATIIATSNSGAIILVSHDNVEIAGFTVRHDGAGRGYPDWYWSSGKAAIHLLNVKKCVIHDNQIVSRGCGIWLYGSNQNSLFDNTIQECDYGITVQSSNQNTLTKNTMTNNTNGLSLMSASGNNLKDNSLNGNSYNLAISSSDLSGYINNMDSSNSLEEKPVIYWIDESDRSVPDDAGCVVLVNCKNITVNGLTLKPSSQTAITLAGTQGCQVTNNHVSNSSIGIQIFNSQYDSIFDNHINVSSEGIASNGNGTIIQGNNIVAGTGISIGGYYQTIIGNTINSEQTSYFADYAITCSGGYNNISYNTMKAAMRGISITGSNNVFYGNDLDNCNEIELEKSDGNVIAKNNLAKTRIYIDTGSGNIICANKITAISDAITILTGYNNVFYANTIENCNAGLRIGSSAERVSNNTFYHNNFVNNERQIGKSCARNAVNFYDNGNEGNYWSDYSESNRNFDGVGASGYELKSYYDGTNGEVTYVCGIDHYPLSSPYDISKATVELPVWVDPAKPSAAIQPHNSNANESPTIKSNQLIVIAVTATIATIAVVAVLFLKKRSRQHTSSNR
jgi:parallel beta-helix repeat protein